MDFKIESNVPLADKTHRGRLPGTKMQFPWSDMEVGDSFFVPVRDHDMVRLMNKITASGRGFFGAGCIKARSVMEEEYGIRVWRMR